MKSLKYIFPFALAGIALIYGCNKEITSYGSDWSELVPSNYDTGSGNWKTIVLTNSAEIAVPAPAATNSPGYLAELAEAKSNSQNITSAQQQIIEYWSAGAVLRWNEILRELVAKYNLPPVANNDGTYPIPNAANPFAYPQFPFSNPPYAARTYAYVSVAQYDAMVAANHYRQVYKRQAPYNIDNTISPAITKNDVPSYPSEDAALAGATAEVLKLLFPTEIGYINQKADELKYYKLWAGATVKSDITEGEILGKAVAAKVIARAKADNMKNAIGNQHLWDSLENRISSTGETPWKSLESPVRPPMLPFFGNVKTWLFDAATLISIRPPAPLKTASSEFAAQVAEVKKEADKNDREKIRIVHYWADGAGTYTPPGHWNAIAAKLIHNAKLSEVRTARNIALLNMAMMDAAIACWDAKSFYYVPRPTQMDPDIKTLTGLPNFPSYTSGHSTFSGSAATVLGHIFPGEKASLDAMANEASLSRLYGGIHYRMDCEAGLKCGQTIGGYAVSRAKTDGAE